VKHWLWKIGRRGGITGSEGTSLVRLPLLVHILTGER
jgi:hypothetical protein